MVTRKIFDSQIRRLHEDIINMTLMIKDTFGELSYILKHPDEDRAKKLVENDRLINDYQKKIETHCLSLLLEQQPVASDLRLVSMGLKVVTDLERIGDQCSDIADIMLQSKFADVYKRLPHIPHMIDDLSEMTIQTYQAFKDDDLDLAKSTAKQDQEVNALFIKCKQDVVELIKQDEENVDAYLDYLMIAKHLEKIGDHIVNVCEWINYNDTGDLDDLK